MTGRDKKETLKKIFEAAVQAASPSNALQKNLQLAPSGKRLLLKAGRFSIDLNKYKRVYAVGGGKAVCPMARALEGLLGKRLSGGLVVTKYGHSEPLKKIIVKEASHPVPDRNGLDGAGEILRIAEQAGEDDLVIVLLTGGASALLPLPVFGLRLRDKQKASALLINSGATIDEINTVRKHLSAIKGGFLAAAAHPATVLTLIVSDVVGNSLSTIASGPAAPDPTTFADALKVIGKYGLSQKMPRKVMSILREGSKGELTETPKPGEPLFKRAKNIIIADNLAALKGAAAKARALGFRPLILSSSITGNTREAASFFASVLKEVKNSGNPVKPPACVLMGGETTLKITGKGLGGRNQEFALSLAMALKSAPGIHALSAGTDGTDGPTEAAGAYALPDTLGRAGSSGLDPQKYLTRNDSYSFFRKIDGLFITGPTGTNVMDIAIGIVE
ncbi:glycerate 2-kinase [uncultured bacterium]|nr:glycerate 2-kinase [uncultured bacterium]